MSPKEALKPCEQQLGELLEPLYAAELLDTVPMEIERLEVHELQELRIHGGQRVERDVLRIEKLSKRKESKTFKDFRRNSSSEAQAIAGSVRVSSSPSLGLRPSHLASPRCCCSASQTSSSCGSPSSASENIFF